MKLVIILTMVCCLQVSASGYGQEITLSVKDAPLERVFSIIEQQSGYRFIYSQTLVQQAYPVTLKADHLPVEEVLKQCLKNQPLIYVLSGNHVIIKAKEEKQLSMAPQPITISGKVTNESGDPVAGATITIKGTSRATSANIFGEFTLPDVAPDAVLVISAVSYETQEIKVDGRTTIQIKLNLAPQKLEEVEVVANTGYQTLPKERITGSFAQVDNKLLNRRVSTDIISRLEGVASGLAFYRNSSSDQPALNIRGRSTIFANTQPLIVLDNFAYDGDINSINPNDIESITILKDAAASSIWGVRAGNGVIVITSKKGRKNRPPQVQFTSNLTISQKPDLFYIPRANSADYIEIEKLMFANGFYTTLETSANKTPFTPVMELLIAKRDNVIPAAEADARIEALKQYDVRNDYSRCFLRNSLAQQYALNINGGGVNSAYFLSVGYDKNLAEYVGNNLQRISINASNSFTLAQKLDIQTGLYYAQTNRKQNSPGINDLIAARKYYPYARLIDDAGNPVAINYGYRNTYIESRQQAGFLNWQYVPIDELNNADNSSAQHYIRATGGLRYQINNALNVEVKYQLEKSITTATNLMGQETYFTRDLINKYYNPTTTVANAKYPVPLGAILDKTNSDLTGHTGRGQINYSNKFGESELNVIAGIEVKEVKTTGNSNRLYGYDPSTLNSTTVDYRDLYPTNPLGTQTAVPYPRTQTSYLDRFISYFANAAYTYAGRYTLSGSGRIDKSNLFGVSANQKSVPLWSLGGKWDVDKEGFYNVSWLSSLKMRATYGYSGNIDKTTTAFTTASYSISGALIPVQSANVINPPNPELRWEKISMINVGIDFDIKKGIISGSVDYFSKRGTDLIGESSIDPTTGLTAFKGNLANIKGHGIDLAINTGNINRRLKWTTNFLFSYATDKVTAYFKSATAYAYITDGGANARVAPSVGRPVASIYSFPFAGLDPTNGDPMGYYKGQLSKDYYNIVFQSSPDDLTYHGPARPPFFGGLRNNFTYKNFTFSFNVTYKLGYYFRRTSVDYSSVRSSWMGHKDMATRWKKQGDELITNVPSFPVGAPLSSLTYREFYFYGSSSALVEKADHIRLQDINLSYELNRSQYKKLPFNNLQVYLYANNLGILWRANTQDIDPDAIPDLNARFLPAQKTLTIGLKANF